MSFLNSHEITDSPLYVDSINLSISGMEAGGFTRTSADAVHSVFSYKTIQETFDNHTNIFFPDGIYNISETIQIKLPNTKVRFAPNVVLRATNGIKRIFNNTNMGHFNFNGEGALFDLNNVADYALSVNGSVNIQYITIKNINTFNRPVTTDRWESALEIRNCQTVDIDNIKVFDYAYNNKKGKESYALGLFYSQDVIIKNVLINNGCIGILTQGVKKVTIDNFNISKIKDNAIYTLNGTVDCKFKTGFIDSAEEGMALYGDTLVIDNVTIKNCTNKGITLRNLRNSNITSCKFSLNNTHIGDDDNLVSENNRIERNLFSNSTEYSISLMKTNKSKIDNNDFFHIKSPLEIILIRGGTGYGNDNEISSNRFNDTNKISLSCINIAGSEGGNKNTVKHNEFISGKLGVKLTRTTGNGLQDNYIIHNIYRDLNTKTSFSKELNPINVEHTLS